MAVEEVGISELFSIVVENPLLFLFMSFITGSLRHGPIFLLVLALITAVITYPFIFLGKWVFKEFSERLKELEKWQNKLLTTLTLSLILWLLIRAWYALTGSSFIVDIPGFIAWVLITGLIFHIFYLGAKIIHSKIIEKWTMPSVISYFLIDYIFNLIGWIILYVAIVVISMDTGIPPVP